jgi:PAS domain-containing protein
MPKRGVTEFLKAFEDVGTTFFDVEVDLLVVLDESGNISRVNPAFEQALNRLEPSVLRHGLISYIHPDDLAIFMHSFDPATSPIMFRLLRTGHGAVPVRLVAYKFKRTDAGQRGYLILRRAIEHETRADWERKANWSG